MKTLISFLVLALFSGPLALAKYIPQGTKFASGPCKDVGAVIGKADPAFDRQLVETVRMGLLETNRQISKIQKCRAQNGGSPDCAGLRKKFDARYGKQKKEIDTYLRARRLASLPFKQGHHNPYTPGTKAEKWFPGVSDPKDNEEAKKAYLEVFNSGMKSTYPAAKFNLAEAQTPNAGTCGLVKHVQSWKFAENRLQKDFQDKRDAFETMDPFYEAIDENGKFDNGKLTDVTNRMMSANNENIKRWSDSGGRAAADRAPELVQNESVVNAVLEQAKGQGPEALKRACEGVVNLQQRTQVSKAFSTVTDIGCAVGAVSGVGAIGVVLCGINALKGIGEDGRLRGESSENDAFLAGALPEDRKDGTAFHGSAAEILARRKVLKTERLLNGVSSLLSIGSTAVSGVEVFRHVSHGVDVTERVAVAAKAGLTVGKKAEKEAASTAAGHITAIEIQNLSRGGGISSLSKEDMNGIERTLSECKKADQARRDGALAARAPASGPDTAQ